MSDCPKTEQEQNPVRFQFQITEEPAIVTAARLRFNREFLSRLRITDQVVALGEQAILNVRDGLDEFPSNLSFHFPFGRWMTQYLQGLEDYLSDFRRCLNFVREHVVDSSVFMRCEELKQYEEVASPLSPPSLPESFHLEVPLCDSFREPELPDMEKLNEMAMESLDSCVYQS